MLKKSVYIIAFRKKISDLRQSASQVANKSNFKTSLPIN